MWLQFPLTTIKTLISPPTCSCITATAAVAFSKQNWTQRGLPAGARSVPQRGKVLSFERKASRLRGRLWQQLVETWPHVFAIRGNRKKWVERWRGGGREKKGRRCGGTWRPDVYAGANSSLWVALWGCSKGSNRRQTGSWVLSRQLEHLEKLNWVSLSSFRRKKRCCVLTTTSALVLPNALSPKFVMELHMSFCRLSN